MKKLLLSAIAISILSGGLAHAAEGIKKDITIVATINDAIFVSKPDGSTWYDKEELFAKDYTQSKFASKDLPVRVFTTNPDFTISLTQPLTISRNDGAQLNNVQVVFAGKAVTDGALTEIKQTTTSTGGYDNTYTLKINAEAPTNVAAGSTTNGQYQGDLVLLFEPKP
ncbi:CS1 type fimbrial major subunit [Providencia vermicola]|uniref:CS1 type fimbrial major subunit n=1 Tax=Providencia vermicola TaxID=333965 RepID=UPI003524335D